MECPWQTYTKLQESLNKGNLINANLQFVLHNGDSVSGLLGDFSFDCENLFLELKNVSINAKKLSKHTLMGMHICRWRIVELSTSNTEKTQSTFSQAAFNSNHPKSNEKKPPISSEVSNKIFVDNSVLKSKPIFYEKKEKNQQNILSFLFKEIDLSKDDDNIIIDLEALQLPASNDIELIQRKSVYSTDDLVEYFEQCAKVVNKLKTEAMIGFVILPQSDENLLNACNNTVENVHQLNRPLFMQNVLADMKYSYFCFSTGEANYAFCFNNLDEKEEELNRRVFLLLKPLFESNTTQKIVNGCAIMSGILWHKYRIKLDNVCDLQLIDRQIQKINIFHRKRPYNKFAPPPNVNQLRTIITMIDEYLTITLRPIETVANWASYTTKMGNVIRMSLIFLRELSARMNYELMHYMFAYSNRPLFSLRCGTEKEVQTLTTKFTLDEYYQQLLEQPLFDTEKGIHFKLDLKKVFPFRFYDPNLFIGKK